MSSDRFFHGLRSLGGRLKFFSEGWGCAFGVSGHHTWLGAGGRAADGRAPPPLPLRFAPHPLGRVATFESPARAFLPPEAVRGRAWFVEPAARAAHPASSEPPPVVIQLAATGDHGCLTRYMLFARHFARAGIASVLLENPFYGSRAPPGQKGAKLKTVAHLADMGRATIEECAGILSHLFERGHTRLCAFGISQGGLHAAMAASVCPFPVHCVSALAPASAAPVFTRGCLSTAVKWSALSSKGEEDARKVLAEHLDSVASISLFPEPPAPGRHILLQARSDDYVQIENVAAWRAARPKIEVRMIPGGHVTAVVFQSAAIRAAVEGVLMGEPEYATESTVGVRGSVSSPSTSENPSDAGGQRLC